MQIVSVAGSGRRPRFRWRLVLPHKVQAELLEVPDPLFLAKIHLCLDGGFSNSFDPDRNTS